MNEEFLKSSNLELLDNEELSTIEGGITLIKLYFQCNAGLVGVMYWAGYVYGKSA